MGKGKEKERVTAGTSGDLVQYQQRAPDSAAPPGYPHDPSDGNDIQARDFAGGPGNCVTRTGHGAEHIQIPEHYYRPPPPGYMPGPRDDNGHLFRHWMLYPPDQSRIRAVRALLVPAEQPYLTDGPPDKILEPVFSDKALLIMAICQARPHGRHIQQIVTWIRNTFQCPRYEESGYPALLNDALRSDGVFVEVHGGKTTRSQQFYHIRWRLQSEFERDLDFSGGTFDVVRHIDHHRAKLVSRYAKRKSSVQEDDGDDGSSEESREEEDENEETEDDVDVGNVNDNVVDDDKQNFREIESDHVSDRSLSRADDSRTPAAENRREAVSFALPVAPDRSVVHPAQLTRDATDKASDQSQPANTLDLASNAQIIDTAVKKNDGQAALGDSQEMTQTRASDLPPEPPLLDNNLELLPDGRRDHTTLLNDAIPYDVAGGSKMAKVLLFAASGNYDTSKEQQHLPALDDPSQASGHGVDDIACYPNDDRVSRSSGTACTVLELLLEPQWASPSKGSRLEQPLTGKALIVMAFGHTEVQDTTNNWKPATRRMSAQNVMQLYHRLPARFRKRISSAYRAAAEDLYSSEAAHVHLSFQFVNKRATDPTHNLHQGWRVAGDFHLGRDSSSPRFALAMSVPVEQHLMKVSKTMVHITRVQTDDLERDARRSIDVSTEGKRLLSFDLPNRTREDVEGMRRILSGGFVQAELDSGMALFNNTRRARESRATVRLTALASVYMPLTLLPSLLGMEVMKMDSGIWALALVTLCVSSLVYIAYNIVYSGLPRVLSRRVRSSGHIPTVPGGSTAQDIKLSGSVVSTLTGAARYYLEEPVPLGMSRIRWKCRCGKLIYDDYLERKVHTPKSPAGVTREFAGDQLRAYRSAIRGTGAPSKDLVRTGVDSSSRQHGQGSGGSQSSRGSVNSRGSVWTLLGETFKGFQKTGPALPQHDAKNDIAKSAKASAPPKPDHLEFLLLCIPFKSHANKLMNIDTTTPPSSDIAFFRLLRQTYAKNRGRFRNLFSIRALSEIRFVQFEVFRNDLADVRKFDCIPPEAQKDNYLYRPMPAEFEPPIGKNQMRHLYDHPDHADDLPVCYSRVPRKLRERLSAAPGIGRSDGWGICFIEGISWPRVCALGLAGVLASTVFGVAWTVVQKDIQGGFGVASYVLALLVLGLGALQGAFEM